jgi:hypothetical protein
VLHKKTLIALAAAVTLGCVPVATNALAAGHQNNGHGGGQTTYGHAMGGHAMAGPARGGRGVATNPSGGRVVVRSGGGGYYGGGGGGYYGGERVVVRSGGGGYYGGETVYRDPVYDSCAGYGYGDGYGGCPGYGIPIVGGVINEILGGYGTY